jgi:hypothetical protein
MVDVVLHFFDELATDAGDAARDLRGEMSVAHEGKAP